MSVGVGKGGGDGHFTSRSTPFQSPHLIRKAVQEGCKQVQAPITHDERPPSVWGRNRAGQGPWPDSGVWKAPVCSASDDGVPQLSTGVYRSWPRGSGGG